MGAQAVDYRVSKVIVCCKDCGQDVGLYPARHKCQDVVRPPLPPLPTKFDDSPNLRVPRKPIPSYDSNNNNNNNNNNEINRSRPTSAASSNSSGTTHHNVTSDTSSATSTGSKWSRFVRSPSNNNMKTATTTTTNNNNHGGENDDDSFYYNNFAAHLPDQTTDSGGSPGQAGKKLWGKVRQNEKWKQLNEKCKFITIIICLFVGYFIYGIISHIQLFFSTFLSFFFPPPIPSKSPLLRFHCHIY